MNMQNTMIQFLTKRHLAALAACFAAVSCSVADMDVSMSFDREDPAYAPEGTGDKFDEYEENSFIKTEDSNVSTFSIDADGASYAYMRKMLSLGRRPAAGAVRIEEYLNYFTFNYPEPGKDHTVALNGEVGECPWNREHMLMRLGLKGKSPGAERPLSNYVFLIDVSGSMNSDDKIGLLKRGLAELVDQLEPEDRISIITYSGSVKRLLESTRAAESDIIKSAISKLVASGSTAGGEAMEMAYKEALDNYIDGGNNRVIMGTDGDFNVGVTSTDALLEMVEGYAAKGIYLTVCGFGTGNLNDSMMETISNKGNGTYVYIDSKDEMTKVFVNEVSSFYSVANDVKVQVTFDKDAVESYRLIGYENRLMADSDFEDDGKDAGEIGAGQTVTALYEIIPGKKYQEALKVAGFEVRYKKALGEESAELGMDVVDSGKVSDEFSFAAGVAAYGMLLKDSKYKGASTYDMAWSLVGAGLHYDKWGYRAQLRDLIQKAGKID